jgi:hypothetical protein
LTEIGRYYGSFNEFVIGGGPFRLVFRAFLTVRRRPLPFRPPGAIMILRKGGAA